MLRIGWPPWFGINGRLAPDYAIKKELVDLLEKYSGDFPERNSELFLYHFGFIDNEWHTFRETCNKFFPEEGRGSKDKRAKAESIIKRIINRIIDSSTEFESLKLFQKTINSVMFVNSIDITKLLFENGLIEESNYCNLIGLISLCNYFRLVADIVFVNTDLSKVNINDYSHKKKYFIINKLVFEKVIYSFELAKEASSNYGLANLSYLYQAKNDSLIQEEYLTEIICSQDDNYYFRMKDGNVYYHLKTNINELLIQTLGKIFFVCKQVSIDQLTEAIIRPTIRRYGAETRKIISNEALNYFIQQYNGITCENGKITYNGKKVKLTGIEATATAYLKKKPQGVKFSELLQYLMTKGYDASNIGLLTSYSPIISVDESEGWGNYSYYLIGNLPNIKPLQTRKAYC